MSINFNCTNRIKPRLLREQKTEALLVFIRTTLEQIFNKNQKLSSDIEFGSKEDTEYIYTSLNKLLKELQECVVNSSYLQSLIENSGKNRTINIIVQKEKPLMTYYDSIVKSIQKNLPNGTNWIPELMVTALLSQWILEEEKSTYLYPFLNDIDYLKILEKYDKARIDANKLNKEVIMNMYNLSTKLIDSLKKSTYKTTSKNTKRIRKK